MQATMLGVPPQGATPRVPDVKPIAAKPAVPVPVPKPATEAVTPNEADVGLPAAKPKALPVPAKAGVITRPEIPIPKGTPALAAPGALSKKLDADLPAVRADLPVARAGQPPPGKPASPAAAKPAAPPAAASFGEVDLPSPAPGGGRRLTPGVGFELDLPARNGGTAAAKAPPAPAPKSQPKPMEAFGEIDLPGVAEEADLPLASAASNLPAVATNNLPAVATNNLPSVANTFPEAADAFPMPADVLPVTANALPTPANVLPSPKPGAAAATLSLPPDEADFGELDLPPGPSAAAKPKAPPPAPPTGAQGRTGAEFSLASDPPPLAEFSLPPEPLALETPSAPRIAAAQRPPAPPTPAAEEAPFGGFGEVDLAVADSGQSAEAAIPTSSGEASLDATEQAIPTAARKERSDTTPQRRRGGRAVLGVLTVVLVGGSALELTPFGAFGRNAIVDTLSAGDYERRTLAAADGFRKKMGGDLFPDARSAADQAAAAHADAPRARALTAYAALAEFEMQLRYGNVAERMPRAKQWLAELREYPDTKYLGVALAAQDALNGDLDKARKALDAASKRDVGDSIQEDIAFTRGELELRAHDPKAALEAFAKAQTLSKSARAEFGKARALAMARELPQAREAYAETLRLAPKHVEARIGRATILWEQSKDEAGALADLAAILEGEAKSSASEAARAEAFALRGWIHLGRGRAGEARTAFEAAMKADGRNVKALVGQGEVLFTEGRFTEALTRFDTAVQTDPTSVLAIVSAAKTKLALERLADAKGQLSGARAKFPKEWRVAYWLGRAEQALGNKPVAEKEYLAAIDLLDKKDPDAVQAYVALSALYAAQSKSKEADQKLAEAKKNLPDTASLRRAIGEIAAQRGDFDVAVQEFRAAIEKDPDDIGTHFRMGVTLRHMHKIPEASAELDKVVAVDKDYPGLSLERGRLLEESGDIEKALEQFQGALAKAPDDPDVQLRVAAAYTGVGRPADAVPILKKVMEKRPQSAEAQHYLGRALFLQGGTAQNDAMRFLKRAVELDPNRAEYHLYVAWAANNAIPVQIGVAREAVDKALALDSLLADGYWQRGVLERKVGAVDDAIKDLKRALELKPGRIDAHAALAECYEDKNDLGTAMAEWQKAIGADGTKPAWRYRFGKILFDRGNTGEASKHLLFAADEGEKADPKPGWLASAEFLAGEVLRKSGKKAEAVERYRRFLEIAPTNSPDRKEALAALSDLGATPRPK
jgi:tetratricopeptide (TPR) repeat protein